MAFIYSKKNKTKSFKKQSLGYASAESLKKNIHLTCLGDLLLVSSTENHELCCIHTFKHWLKTNPSTPQILPMQSPGYCCEMAGWSNAHNTNTQTYTFHAQLPRKLHAPQEVHVNPSPMGRTVGNGWGMQYSYLTTPHFMLLSRYTSSSASQGLWWAVLSH